MFSTQVDLASTIITTKISRIQSLNTFSTVRRHWRPPLSLPDSAIRRQWRPNKKGLKICLGEAGNKVRVRFFVRHLGYVRRLERLNLYSLEKRRLRGQLIETLKMLKGVNNID